MFLNLEKTLATAIVAKDSEDVLRHLKFLIIYLTHFNLKIKCATFKWNLILLCEFSMITVFSCNHEQINHG